MVWSVVVAKLPQVGFAYTTDQLFWLAALPGLSGATFRIFYSFMVPIFGGRLWTTLSTASLLIPALGIGYAVQNPQTPRSEEHKSELQSLMRISYADFCLNKTTH